MQPPQPPQPPYGGQPPMYGPPPGPPGPPMPPGPPGWGPPPPRRPNNNGAAVVIVIVAALVLLVGGGAVLVWGFGVGVEQAKRAAAAPTLPDLPTPPTYSPPSMPSYSPPPLPSFPPDTPSDPYTPPTLHYGAIAVAPDGSVGKSWDYSSASAAKRRALNECPRSGCKVLTTFVNSCGAVAYNSRTNRYWGGQGATRTAAEKDAISNAGGGHWITWVCTTRP
ncbi:DUF4189 domain-containing protein [Actinoallomurus rhizosphaericola]|uniref:DUF4189 domain-containing protein n=1 Tax=Actinoallomurus rhizosphaericola TaxID=2952536 RepID=UPI0027E29F5E|nr:DUF4189 domain-containing protein [Actinoallomurus rhizosphaericola]